MTPDEIVRRLGVPSKTKFPNAPLLRGASVNRGDLNDLVATLSVRARGGLKRAGLASVEALERATIHDLIGVPNLGVRTLVELVLALDSYAEPMPGPENSLAQKPPITQPVPSLSKFLTKEARRLARTGWARKMKCDDVRLQGSQGKLALEGRSIAEAARSIAFRSADPPDPLALGQSLRSIREFGDRAIHLSLEEELRELAHSWKGASGPDAAITRLGWDGRGGDTLERIGQQRGVTRERIRQIETKVLDALAGREVWAPSLEKAVALCRALAPRPIAELSNVLREKRITKGLFHPFGVLTAADATGRPHGLTILPIGTVEWIFPKQLARLPNSLLRIARRSVSRNGIVSVAELCASLAPRFGSKVDDSIVKAVLAANPEIHWLGSDKEWLWIQGRPDRNRLINNLNKILSVAPRIHISELREGLGRHHRVNVSPPKAAILALCELLGDNVEDSSIVVSAKAPRPEDVLAGIELKMLQIVREHGPLLQLREFHRLCTGKGVNANSFMLYLTYSPIIQRFAPGVYGIRGTRVAPGEAEALIRTRRTRHPHVRRDYGWTKRGHAWIAYRISWGLLHSGVTSIPAPLVRALGKDHWDLKMPDGSKVGTLRCRNGSAWGFLPFFRRHGAEIGDTMLLVIAGASVVAFVGSEELLDSVETHDLHAFQAPSEAIIVTEEDQ